MTKQQIIQAYFDFILGDSVKELDSRLDKLMEQDKITSGANYYIYTSTSWYVCTKISDMLNRAGHSKSYTQYINCSTTSWDWNYCWKSIQEEYQKALAFVTEQESLPFEQTQKQILIRNGEIK